MLVPIRVAEVMHRGVETIPPEATVTEIAARLRAAEVGSVVVVSEDGGGNGNEPIGIVTTTDLSYYLPRLTFGGDGSEDTDHGTAASPEMAYEEPDWEFDYEGDPETVDVGDVVRFRKTLSDDDVRAFADASGDTNRVHLDEAFAAGTRFGGRICHGTLVGGTVSGALARLPGLTIYLAQELSYQGPVEIGETVTAVCEVVENVGDSRYRLSTTMFGGDAERVIEGEAVVLIDDLPNDAGDVERPATSA